MNAPTLTSSISLVVFDMAGTTVHDDDFVNLAFRSALKAAGLPVRRDQVNAVMGYPKPLAISHLLALHHGTEPHADEVGVIHDDFLHRMNHFYATNEAVKEMDGTSAVFWKLQQAGIKVALNTGFSRSTADIIINRLGWRDEHLIDASVTSDEVERGRPYPDMIHHLMEQFGIIDPQTVAKVGDTPSDLQEGTQAGCCMVIGVTNGSHTAKELAPHPHTHLLGSVADVPQVVLPAMSQA